MFRVNRITSARLAITAGALCCCIVSGVSPAWAEADPRLPNAAMNRDLATVHALLEQGADPNSIGQFETPALHWLVRIDALDSVKKLLDAGADPNSLTSTG